jgi:hypothetical protein
MLSQGTRLLLPAARDRRRTMSTKLLNATVAPDEQQIGLRAVCDGQDGMFGSIQLRQGHTLIEFVRRAGVMGTVKRRLVSPEQKDIRMPPPRTLRATAPSMCKQGCAVSSDLTHLWAVNQALGLPELEPGPSCTSRV